MTKNFRTKEKIKHFFKNVKKPSIVYAMIILLFTSFVLFFLTNWWSEIWLLGYLTLFVFIILGSYYFFSLSYDKKNFSFFKNKDFFKENKFYYNFFNLYVLYFFVHVLSIYLAHFLIYIFLNSLSFLYSNSVNFFKYFLLFLNGFNYFLLFFILVFFNYLFFKLRKKRSSFKELNIIKILIYSQLVLLVLFILLKLDIYTTLIFYISLLIPLFLIKIIGFSNKIKWYKTKEFYLYAFLLFLILILNPLISYIFRFILSNMYVYV